MSLIDKLKWRYATKKFNPNKKLQDSVVNAILEGANLTASSTGLQPFRFILVKNMALREELKKYSFNQNQITEASHLIVLAHKTLINKDLINKTVSNTEKVRALENGSLDGYRKMIEGYTSNRSQEELEQWAKYQTYIVLGNLLAICADFGVDSCPMEGILPHEYDRLLNLKELDLSTTVALPIGYRAEEDGNQFQKKSRLPLEEMLIEI